MNTAFLLRTAAVQLSPNDGTLDNVRQKEKGKKLSWARSGQGLGLGVGLRMSKNQGGRQQLRSLGGRKTKAKRKACSSLANTCPSFSSLPFLGIRSCN